MAERVTWDYWLYEDIGDHRNVSIYLLQDLDERDWRNKKYELEFHKWCRKYFWDADQAALISFFRDPEKLEKAVEFDQFEEDEQFDQHFQLKKHILALRDLIIDAQKNGILTDFFRCTSSGRSAS